jgi:tetratricopeptide (TPR) repeat protein
MKKLLVILLSIFLIACDTTIEKNRINPIAIKLNDSAVSLLMTFDTIKIINGIKLLDSAIQIQPDYDNAYWNKISLQTQIGLKDEALNTSYQYEKIRPKSTYIKMTIGVILDSKGDSIDAQKKYKEAEKIYNQILDTIKVNSKNYNMLMMDMAINLKLLKNDIKANKILKSIKLDSSSLRLQPIIDSFVKMDRKEIVNNFKPR